jgi:hypothetical protein
MHRMRFEFEYLSFANVSPTLPERYSDILVRRLMYYAGMNDHRPEVRHYIGSIYQSPSGDIVVVWR